MLSKIFLGYITVKKKQKKPEPPLVSTLTLLSLFFFLKPIPFPLSLSLPATFSPQLHPLFICLWCLFPPYFSLSFSSPYPLTAFHPPFPTVPAYIHHLSVQHFFLSILTILIKDVKNSYWKSSHKHVVSLHLQQTFPVSQGLGSSAGLSYTPYLTPMSHSMGLVPTDILPSTPVIVPGSPPVSVTAGSSSNQKLLRTDKLEVTHPIRILLHGT